MNVPVVNSAGGSFCWNYTTDTFYGNYTGDNVCCIYAGFEGVLSVTAMLVDLSVTIMQVTCFYCNYAVQNFCNTYTGDSLCSKHVGTIFTVIMQMGVSVAIIQVVLLWCNMHMTASIVIIQVSFIAMLGRVSSNNFIFLSLTDSLFSQN